MWIVIAVVVLLAAGAGFFFLQKGASNNPAPAAGGATAQVKGNADPVHDLKIQRATMDKDRNGTMSVWSVSVENKSKDYSYSKIQYETSYIGGDGSVLMENKGIIADVIGPGEQKSFQANDPLYPGGTARYNFKITGATPAAQ